MYFSHNTLKLNICSPVLLSALNPACVHTWLTIYKLTLNVKKTKDMILNKSHKV